MNPVELTRRQIIIKLGDDVEMVFRFIPKGEFRMGSRNGPPSEQPVHRVIVPQDFWLAATPVTQRQFHCYDPDHRNYFEDCWDSPAEMVDLDAALQFCRWLKQYLPKPALDYLVPDLPTEAQWEYACRARSETDFYTGDGEKALAAAGWYRRNSALKTHECWRDGEYQEKFKQPNTLGLYDMHGNIWEWCRDSYVECAYRHRPGRYVDQLPGDRLNACDHEGFQVVRGGSWGTLPFSCRSGFRRSFPPGGPRFQGFRVGLFPAPSCGGAEPG